MRITSKGSIILLLLLNAVAAQGATIFVNIDAVGSNDGMTWENAFVDLQDAIAVARLGDEVWVAQGVYAPGNPGDSRFATFQLVPGVGFYGGFIGDEECKDERIVDLNETILTGDLDGDDDGPNADVSTCCYVHSEAGCDVPTCNSAGGDTFCSEITWDLLCVARAQLYCPDVCPTDLLNDNAYRVVSAESVEELAIMDRFTVAGGVSNEPYPVDRGAGLHLINSNVSVVNCKFITNASPFGTAIYNESGTLNVEGCTFAHNARRGVQNSSGVSIVIESCFSGNSSSAISGNGPIDIVDCEFHDNGAQGPFLAAGSALYLTSAGGDEVTVTNCHFINNVGLEGAAIYTNDVRLSMTNSFMAYNYAVLDGGAMFLEGDATLTNCTVFGNSAGGRAGGVYDVESDVELSNSLIWGNAGESSEDIEEQQITYFQVQPDPPMIGSFIIDHSSVQGWSGIWGGKGNDGLDPLFVDPDGADEIPGTEDDDLRLSLESPAIDSGNGLALPVDEFDLDNDGDTVEPIPVDLDGCFRIVDIDALCEGEDCPPVDRGAFEFRPPCEGDANRDHLVDPLDAGFVLARLNCDIGQGDANCDAADTNVDGIVDPLDVGFVLARFGGCHFAAPVCPSDGRR